MSITPNDIKREAQPDTERRGLTGLFERAANGQRSRIERDAADARNFIHEDEARIVAEGAQVSGELTAQDLRNIAARVAKQDVDDELIAARSGVLSGRIVATLFRAQELKEREAAKAREKDRDRSLYLAALQAQIDALNKQIAEYDDRIKDFEDRHLTAAEKAAIGLLPKDQQRAATDAAFRQKVANGGMTQEQYDEWKHLQDARAEAKADLAGKQADLGAEVSRLRAAGQSVEIEAPSGHLDAQYSELADQASKVGKMELRTMTLEGLASYNGSDRVQKIDEFIANLDEATLGKLAEDKDTNPDIRTRIGLFALKSQISSLDEFKETPDYQEYVSQIIKDATEDVRDALRKESDLTEAETAALYPSFSDTLDAQEHVEADPQPAQRNGDEPTVATPGTLNRPGLG